MTKQKSLYELSSEINAIFELLYEEDLENLDAGFDKDFLHNKIEELQISAERKIAWKAKMLSNIKAEQSMLKSHIEILKGRETRLKKKIDYIENSIVNSMRMSHIDNVQEVDIHIQYKVNAGTVEAFDEDLVPEEYKTKIEEWKIEKGLIRPLLLAGKDVPGCKLQPTYSLKIHGA